MALGLDRAAAGRYVLSRRTPLGGYSFYRTPEWGVEEPSAPDTLAALESLRLLGLEVPGRALTASWVRSLQDGDGGYPTLTIGWAALRSLALLDVDAAQSPAAWLSDREQAFAARRRVEDARGALRDALHLADLLRLGEVGGHNEHWDWVSRLVADTRDPVGGWARPGADLETTALAVELAGRDLSARDRPGAEGMLRRCEDPVLGFRVTPGGGATSVGVLWGGCALASGFGLDVAHPVAVAENLASLQRGDGGLGRRDRAVSSLQDTWRGLDAARLLEEVVGAAPSRRPGRTT